MTMTQAIALRSDNAIPAGSSPATDWRGAYLALAGQLARRRVALGLSQPVLAARLGIGVASLRRWEGGTNPPDAMRLFQWAAALGFTITTLSNLISSQEAHS